MRRLGKIALGVLLAAAALVAGALIWMRTSTDRFSPPEAIRPGLNAVNASFGVYFYGARVGKKIVLFDAGIGAKGGALDALLGSLGATRADVQNVFVTHGHADHVAALSLLRDAHVRAGADDAELIAGNAKPTSTMAKLFGALMPAPPPATVTDPLSGATTVPVGEGKVVRAIPTPGHTPGSYVFLFDGTLFVGDTMAFKNGKLERPPAAIDADRAGAGRAIIAIRDFARSAAVERLCTGHTGCTPPGNAITLLDELAASIGG